MKKIRLSLFLALLMQIPCMLSAQTADTSVSANLTSTGWYRIAVNGPMVSNGTGGNRAAARFILRDQTSSWHQTIEFMASVHYGNIPSIVVMNNSYFSPTPAFSRIRIVEGNTYDGAALEVYISSPTSTAAAFLKDNIQASGWTIVPWTKVTGSTGDQDGIPAGFVARVINTTGLTTGFTTSNGSVHQFNNGKININNPELNIGTLNIATNASYELAFSGSNAANIYSAADLYMLTAAGKSLHLGSNAINSRVLLDADGNLGIGTSDTKGYKLAVNGNAIFTKVKVKPFAGWPDYVFEENYPLPSLQELAGFIQSNKHLPRIPSAADIANNGQDIGELNMQLLQKIEELTLYLLDHNKKIELLQQKVASLEKENRSLKASSTK